MATVVAAQPILSKPPRKRNPRKLDARQVERMARLGLNQVEIAKHQGVNPSTVWRFLEKHKLNKHRIETFKAHRADIFAELQGDAIDLQKRIIASMTDGILSALKPGEKTGLLMALNAVTGTIYDKERLETGKSTQNLSTLSRILGSAFSQTHKALIDKEAVA